MNTTNVVESFHLFQQYADKVPQFTSWGNVNKEIILLTSWSEMNLFIDHKKYKFKMFISALVYVLCTLCIYFGKCI